MQLLFVMVAFLKDVSNDSYVFMMVFAYEMRYTVSSNYQWAKVYVEGGSTVIYLYTEKQDSDNWILKNDLYFNLYTGNQPLTKEDREAIENIDAAKVTDDNHIETKFV